MFLILIVLIVAILGFYNFYYKRRHLPPGPTPLPLIGNLLSINRNPPGEKCFLEWQKKYGKVFTFWNGEHAMVCVTDYNIMAETFQKDGDAYAGRYQFPEYETFLRGGVYGVIFTEGELWRDQRRFALHVLRNFGLGKNLMQEKILDEISAMFHKIDKKLLGGAEEIDICNYFDVSVGSIINALVFGYRFDENTEKEFFVLKKLAANHVKWLMHVCMQLAIVYPISKNLPIIKPFVEKFKKNAEQIFKFFEDRILDHQNNNFDENETPFDFVGSFLAEKQRRDKLGEKHFYSYDQLKSMCFDLWIAGQETTSTTLNWGVAFILRNPTVMDKIYNELDHVIASYRIITVSDKNSLPYINAVICEFSRTANLLPINVPHRTTKDVTVGGYFIPKNTGILPQISTLLINPEIYKNPEQFYPERFLNEKGELIKSDELIPFSLGKRQCLGESLARMELFLFIANLFNQYKFSVGKNVPSLERTYGMTAQCPYFECRMEKRYK